MGRRNIIQRFRRFGAKETIRQMYYWINFLVSKNILGKRYLIRRIFNYRLRLDLHYPGLSRSLVVSGTREEQLKYLLEKELSPGATVLDLGANLGYYTIMMGHLIGSEGKIYAIEPEPRNFSLLKENVLLNEMDSFIEVFNFAAGDRDGKGKFYLSKYSNLHTFVPFTNEGKLTQGVSQTNFIEVDIVNLTTFLAGKRPVDLIRMDIEGYEVEVLKGLESAIKNNLFQGKIVFESHFPKYNEQHNMEEILRMLFKYGYRVTSVTSTDEKKTLLSKRGYQPLKLVQTSNSRFRGIYGALSDEDAVYYICKAGGIRDVVLKKNATNVL